MSRENENCELLAKAQALAIKKGLDETKVVCPFIQVCEGQTCYLYQAEDFQDLLDLYPPTVADLEVKEDEPKRIHK